MMWPWTRRRAAAERDASAAEAVLRDAHEQHRETRKIADESRAMLRVNGFLQAVDTAMGVHR